MKNLRNVIKEIKEKGAVYEKLKEANTIKEIYDICRGHGYEGSYEDLAKEVINLLQESFKELAENELDKVSGGKMDAKKGIASVLSALSIVSGVAPSTGAIKNNVKNSANKTDKKESLKSKAQNIKNYVNKVDAKMLGTFAGTLALGGLGGYLLKSISGSSVENLVCKTEWGKIAEKNLKEFFRVLDKYYKKYVKLNGGQNDLEFHPGQGCEEKSHIFLGYYANNFYNALEALKVILKNEINEKITGVNFDWFFSGYKDRFYTYEENKEEKKFFLPYDGHYYFRLDGNVACQFFTFTYNIFDADLYSFLHDEQNEKIENFENQLKEIPEYQDFLKLKDMISKYKASLINTLKAESSQAEEVDPELGGDQVNPFEGSLF